MQRIAPLASFFPVSNALHPPKTKVALFHEGPPSIIAEASAVALQAKLQEIDKSAHTASSAAGTTAERAQRDFYFKELYRLQTQLVSLQDWVVQTGHRMVIVCEGRDAAGKGGIIKRITQHLNPRVCRVAALPAPTDREKIVLTRPRAHDC